MRRIEVEKRANALRLVQSQGLVYSTQPHGTGPESEPYWPDDRYYSFTSEEIDLFEKAGSDVFDMCCEAADYLLEHPEVIINKMAIPAFAVPQIKESWNRDPPWGSVYGRFDFCFGGLDHPDPRLRIPKFYEFNADTPTSLVEAASIQWCWLEQTGHGNDQCNSITEKLVAAWKRNLHLVEQTVGHRVTVHFATSSGDTSGEDAMNTALLMDTCQQAGWRTRSLFMEQIAISPDGRFYDQHGKHIDVIFKLFPYEIMVEQKFGKACFRDMDTIGQRNAAGEYVGGTIWIEAPYKLLWSNKALFAILWDLFKNDPRSKWLLPTYFPDEAPASMTCYARKPIFSREGWGITLQAEGEVIRKQETDMYGKEGYIIQELALPAEFKDGKGNSKYAVPGLWVVDGEVAGVGIREDASPITSNCSVFAPHSISDGPMKYHRYPVPDIEEIESRLKVDQCAIIQDKHDVLEYVDSIV